MCVAALSPLSPLSPVPLVPPVPCLPCRALCVTLWYVQICQKNPVGPKHMYDFVGKAKPINYDFLTLTTEANPNHMSWSINYNFLTPTIESQHRQPEFDSQIF